MKHAATFVLALVLGGATCAHAVPVPKDGWGYEEDVTLDIGVLGTVRVETSSDTIKHFAFAGRVLLDSYHDLLWQPVGPIQRSDRVIPVLVNTGGSGCPFEMRFVVLTDPATPQVTEPFGNCTSMPAAIDRTPSGWRVVFHAYRGAPSFAQRKPTGKTATFLFHDNAVFAVHGNKETKLSQLGPFPK
ncbi:hypothetical protein [Roseiterribacter gracilis]|uniref:Uncharacterized protein n=1 Tax=Roseiterribacter gracilis TaxID=2812848 RepID=A0A8S8XC55_9PROT|nr:hypothetical protein TMPK1_10570 [Rhodospirillales bacterium TMPK1]